jgi:hypothetical protein
MKLGNDFKNILKEELFNLNKFKLCCIVNDYVLRDYKYNLRNDNDSQIIHEWVHKITNELILLKDIRIITTEILSNIFSEIQTEYMSDLQYIHKNINDVISENKMRAVKRISEICVMINQGDIFKEFVDLYKKSYFN